MSDDKTVGQRNKPRLRKIEVETKHISGTVYRTLKEGIVVHKWCVAYVTLFQKCGWVQL